MKLRFRLTILQDLVNTRANTTLDGKEMLLELPRLTFVLRLGWVHDTLNLVDGPPRAVLQLRLGEIANDLGIGTGDDIGIGVEELGKRSEDACFTAELVDTSMEESDGFLHTASKWAFAAISGALEAHASKDISVADALVESKPVVETPAFDSGTDVAREDLEVAQNLAVDAELGFTAGGAEGGDDEGRRMGDYHSRIVDPSNDERNIGGITLDETPFVRNEGSVVAGEIHVGLGRMKVPVALDLRCIASGKGDRTVGDCDFSSCEERKASVALLC